MVRLKVQEDNVKLKTNGGGTVNLRADSLAPFPEISETNITDGSSSSTGLISGRRAKSAVEAFAPVKDVKVNGTSVVNNGEAQIPKIPTLMSDLDNDEGFISQETDPTVPSWAKTPTKPTYTAQEVGALPDSTRIPANLSELTNDDGYLKVTDLGEIDGEQYDWDVEAFLNTLTETGSYIFLWDEFKYFVDIKAVEVDGTTTVQQIFWGTEEGSGTTAYRNIVVESGEVVSADTITYLTFQEANSVFARNTHTHVRFATQSQSIWDYCNVVANQNANPIVIYFDLSTSKTYVIETFVGNRQPVYKLQKVTEMNDTSYFCQRSSYYYSGQEHWGNWYKFSGEVFTPSTSR